MTYLAPLNNNSANYSVKNKRGRGRKEREILKDKMPAAEAAWGKVGGREEGSARARDKLLTLMATNAQL